MENSTFSLLTASEWPPLGEEADLHVGPFIDINDTASSSGLLDIKTYIYLYKITVPILFGLIALAGFIGNSMVIAVILFKPVMRATVNLLLLNLAFSDMIFVLICVPFVTYHFSAEQWDIGDVTCKLFQFLLYVTVYVTVYTLMSIAIIRFLTIVYTTESARFRTKRNVCIFVGILWGVMLVVNAPVLLVYQVKEIKSNYSPPYYYCGMENIAMGQKIFLSFFVLTYVLPVAFITGFYILILRYLRQNRSASFRASNRSNCSNVAREKTSHASKILIVVMSVFALCWFPLHLHLLIAYFGLQPATRGYHFFRVFCHVLAYSNSCMNPLIYNYVSEDFRKAFRDLCSSSCGERNRPEDSAGCEREMLTTIVCRSRNSCPS